MTGQYTFEANDKRYWGAVTYGEAELEADMEKFATDVPVVSAADDELVKEYVNYVHRNAVWYVLNRKKQEKINYLYMLFTLAVVIAIPVITYLIPATGLLAGSETGVITAQISAILSGGIAFHRMLSSWLFRRNTALDFWRAGTGLKNLHFDLVERWRGGDWDVDRFESDLRETLKRARIVVAQETEASFAAFSNVQVDIGKVLTSAAATSKSLIDDLSGSILDEVNKTRAAKAENKKMVATVRLNLVSARAEVRTLNRQLKRKRIRASLHPDPAVKRALQEEILSKEQALSAKELEQSRNEARYKALVHM